MKKDKTIKRDFYLLVVKVFFATVLSSFIAYLCLFFFLFIFTDNGLIKSTDYFVKYLDMIEENIKENSNDILSGRLIDLDFYSEKIQGEVLDLNGNHLYGDQGTLEQSINIGDVINHEQVMGSYIYRFIPIKDDNKIEAVYVLKAPFSFINNNADTPGVGFVYIVLLISPLIFFVLYLILFTSRLYKSLFNNINVLLYAADKISNGDFDFKVHGLKRLEFIRIQDSFNAMICALKEMINSLSKSEDERKIMVSSIAHDIRTPITVIQGQMDLINDLKKNRNIDITPHLDIIRRNCNRMSMLTENLSLLYKVEKPDFLMNIRKVDLKKMLNEKKQEIRTMVYYKNVKIIFDVNLSQSYYYIDEAMILRVIDNLLYNSLRFTKDGKIELKVREEMTGEKCQLHFKLMDTGSGFREKDPSALFQAFYQNEQNKNHFGLGLYIAKKIVGNFDGKIWAYNNEMGGATVEFYLTLPLRLNYSRK
ncbi:MULTISPECIES: sensor histidine kinase [Pallidibacillus]|jgi:two-component system, OmpR family, lantibiotic biosynthesis sensor histidine kinase NisK/SpaK|uniref:histidine kinase n=1 Tax=Pallidibacillus pasinlerensis TaxID=2703818 RepID=A0ABX0A2Q3_9BACI|nr:MULTISPECIES: HAMP domain-containing sensor histidine kinase [Pallidibacillus]MED1673002.1 HAMP domain-containing sensor histidine kinase [Pallidibacillus thermolactis subsp. kokeshiiformis]NCU17720.1 HAMP domain-containing histidine kinase [Pallidibacillus pasinlerensis]